MKSDYFRWKIYKIRGQWVVERYINDKTKPISLYTEIFNTFDDVKTFCYLYWLDNVKRYERKNP